MAETLQDIEKKAAWAMKGSFPETYGTVAESTGQKPHDQIDSLIQQSNILNLLSSLMEEKEGFEVNPIHVSSYATLMEMALDYPWEGEGGKPSDKALEMLLAGKAILEKMRMGDVAGGTVSYHLPDAYAKMPVASEKQIPIAGQVLKGNLRDILIPHSSSPRVYTESPDTIKTYAHPKINGEKDYLSILKTLLHEPFHLKTTQKDSPVWWADPRTGYSQYAIDSVFAKDAKKKSPGADVYSSGYGFTHTPEGGEYSQEDFKEVTSLLLESLLAKLSKKDVLDITKRLVAGEEIDFSQYK
jgi:hypothetical protein